MNCLVGTEKTRREKIGAFAGKSDNLNFKTLWQSILYPDLFHTQNSSKTHLVVTEKLVEHKFVKAQH